MNLQYSTHHCIRPRKISPFQQSLDQQRVRHRRGNRNLWVAVGKLLFVFGAIVLGFHLSMAPCRRDLDQSLQVVENVRHELMERHMRLGAQKEQLFSAERIRVMAAERLSLHVPEKEQVMFL